MAWAVRPSVVCLTALRPTQRFELFGNIFASTNILGTRTVCVKILEKKFKGFWVALQDKWKGYEKLAFFDQYLALF